jgi:hypothetical protein
MVRAVRRGPCLIALCASLFGAGCASVSPPPSSSVLHPPYFVSRDGGIRYRLPAGWFDATGESQESGRAVFLVREDYGGTLTVNEVHVDPAARRTLAQGSLLQIARITASLESGSKSGLIVREPESVRWNGKEGCAYEVEYANGDRVRTCLVDTGERLYAVAALVNSGAPSAALREIFAVQQAFVAALRW